MSFTPEIQVFKCWNYGSDTIFNIRIQSRELPDQDKHQEQDHLLDNHRDHHNRSLLFFRLFMWMFQFRPEVIFNQISKNRLSLLLIRGRSHLHQSITGIHVKKGDTLLAIDTETMRARHASLTQQIEENDASIKDLEKLTNLSLSESKSSVILDLLTRRYKANLQISEASKPYSFRNIRRKKQNMSGMIFFTDSR